MPSLRSRLTAKIWITKKGKIKNISYRKINVRNFFTFALFCGIIYK